MFHSFLFLIMAKEFAKVLWNSEFLVYQIFFYGSSLPNFIPSFTFSNFLFFLVTKRDPWFAFFNWTNPGKCEFHPDSYFKSVSGELFWTI